VVNTWAGTTWFVEGDISDCFGSLDHDVMLGILGEKIHDNRFLRLLRHMLQAGYLEDWEWNATLSGAPQGGVASPILSNIYLDRLDKFVETVLMPGYTRGVRRKGGKETLSTTGYEGGSTVPATTATMPRFGRCASSNTASPAGIHGIPATGDCVT
jgi:retron-type reverse transcriptase